MKLPAPAPDGATDAEAILAALVRARIKANRDERDKYLSQTDRMLASMASPSKEQFEAEERAARAEVLAELEARLSEGEEPSL